MQQTRIKVVQDKHSVVYYPQYKWFFWWLGIPGDLYTIGVYECDSLDGAKSVVDVWIERQKYYQHREEIRKEKKRTKVVSYIDYP